MKIMKYRIPTKQNISMRIFVLSDIHFSKKKQKKKLNKILSFLANNKFDSIFLVGDIIDNTNVLRKPEEKEILLWFIRELGTQAPTYIVFGNHDLCYLNKSTKWKNDIKYFIDNFAKLVVRYEGIHILNNETIDLNNGYTFSGYVPPLKYAMTSSAKKILKLLTDDNLHFMEKLDLSKTNIFLCHYPDIITLLYKHNRLRGIDLGIAGHNHNGCTQLKIFPLEKILNILGQKNRGLITPSKSMRLKDTKKIRGKIDYKDGSLIINPAITTLSSCTGILEPADRFFYMGASIIEFIPEKDPVN